MVKRVICSRLFETAIVSNSEPATGNTTMVINKWPLDKPLTYALINDAPSIPVHFNNVLAINEAIRNWSSRIQLNIRSAKNGEIPDCPIQFSKTDPVFLNKDGTPNRTILAYGWQGDLEDQGKRGIMVNGWVNWGVFDINFATQIVNTITHEFGHILGLGHNTLPQAVMFWAYNGMMVLYEGVGGDLDQILSLYPARSLPRRIIDIFNSLITRRVGFI